MNGRDYVATVRLSTKDNRTLALPGETCERVPATSLPWIVEQGLAVHVDAPRAADDPAAPVVPDPACFPAHDDSADALLLEDEDAALDTE